MQKVASLTVNAPFDGSIIDELPLTSAQEAEVLLERAYQLHRNRSRWLPKSQRRTVLAELRDKVESQLEPLALQAAREGGKPLIDSRAELKRAVQGIDWAVGEIDRMSGETIPMGAHSKIAFTLPEPRGVVFALSAFNHPFNLIVHQVVTAVAAGCPVIVKPAAATPLSCRSIVQLLYDCDLPPEWCQMIVCSHEVTDKIASDSRLAYLSFIGSAEIGWRLRSRLAPGVHCTLEHGGAAPVILLDDFDLDEALPKLVKGGYYHAGQVCVSVQRLFVPKDRLQQTAEALAGAASRLVVGDPTDPATEVGPLIRPSEAVRVHEWLQDGGDIICGGEAISSNCFAPTVVVNPPKSARISEKELFGPAVALYSYDQIDEAIEEANRPPFTFQAALFGQSIGPILHTAQRLDAMSVMVGDHSAFRVDWMPFGGDRDSGLGVGGIPYTIKDLLREKLIVIDSKEISQ